MKYLMPFILSFIPIFVAVDSLGNIPIFISLTQNLNKRSRWIVVNQSVATATIIALSFMIVGELVLKIMGITINDFKIAGGILLLVLSINFLLPGKSKGAGFETIKERDVGVFPLGTPLVTGPAVLTTTLMMLQSYGIIATFVSLVLNMAIVWLIFAYAETLMHNIGPAGARAFSKVVDIILASIAIMMIRQGVVGTFYY
ncbi:MAG: MarC family protein [Candidatus Omnitrophota bacterium]|nr:MarC family protein [Candidatus Omnitrophota bacterium]